MDLKTTVIVMCMLLVQCKAWLNPHDLHEVLAAAEWDSLHLVCDVRTGDCPAADDVHSIIPAVCVYTDLRNHSLVMKMFEEQAAPKQLNWLVFCTQCEMFLNDINQFEKTHDLPGYLTYRYQWILQSTSGNVTGIEDSLGTIRNLVLFDEDNEIYTARFGLDRRYFQKVNPQSRFQRTNLFPNLLTGMNAVTLTVVILPWPPHIIKSSSGAYSGLYIEILKIMAQYLNFTIRFTETRDGQYGALEDGEWNGMIREIMDKKADVAGVLTQSYERSLVVEQLNTAVIAGQEAILYHKPEPIEMSLGLLVKPFSALVWLAFVGSIIASVVAYFVTEKANINQTPDKSQGYTSYSAGYILRSTLNQGSPWSSTKLSSRIIYTFYNIGWIVLNATYTAFLVSFLSVKKDTVPFTTVVELSANSDYKIGALGGGIFLNELLRFNFSKVDPYYQLREKLMKESLSDETLLNKNFHFHYERLVSEKYAFLASTHEYDYLVAESCSVDMLKEKGRRVLDSFVLQKNSAYAVDFDRALMIIHEKMLHYHLLKKYLHKPKQCVSSHNTVGLEHIYSVFYLLFGGIVTAFIVLVCEIVYKLVKA